MTSDVEVRYWKCLHFDTVSSVNENLELVKFALSLSLCPSILYYHEQYILHYILRSGFVLHHVLALSTAVVSQEEEPGV